MNLSSRHRFSIPQEVECSLTSADRHFIQSMCCRKLKFRLKSEAVRRVTGFLANFEQIEFCTVYRCKFCGGYHFSTHEHAGFNEDDAQKKLAGLHGKQRKKRIKNIKMKNQTIMKLSAANLMSTTELMVWCPPKI